MVIRTGLDEMEDRRGALRNDIPYILNLTYNAVRAGLVGRKPYV